MPPKLTPPTSPVKGARGDPSKSRQAIDLRSPAARGSSDNEDIGVERSCLPARRPPAVRFVKFSAPHNEAEALSGVAQRSSERRMAFRAFTTFDGADEGLLSDDEDVAADAADSIHPRCSPGDDDETPPVPASSARLPYTPDRSSSGRLTVTPVRRAPSVLLYPRTSSSRRRATQSALLTPDRYLTPRTHDSSERRHIKRRNGVWRVSNSCAIPRGPFHFGSPPHVEVSPAPTLRASTRPSRSMHRSAIQHAILERSHHVASADAANTGEGSSIAADFFSASGHEDDLALYRSRLAMAFAPLPPALAEREIRAGSMMDLQSRDRTEHDLEWRDNRWFGNMAGQGQPKSGVLT